MTAAEATRIAQADPVPALTRRWGEVTLTARQRVAALEDSLRELDTITEQLAAHDLVVATDLGPTGNAARNAFTAARADADTQAFRLPKDEADRRVADFQRPYSGAA